NYDQITDYFKQLDKASERMKMIKIGTTSEGRDQYIAVVSSPQNLKPENLERYRKISQRLATRPDSLTDAQAEELSKSGKTIAWINFGIHSTEVAPTQTAPKFAYDLLKSETAEAKSIRQNVITLFNPNVNPDGTQHVSDWYMKYVGTKYQDSQYPELYQKYAGHDDNRDWFMFNLPETRNQGNILWHEWLPQLVYDTHQTAEYPARIFVPPFKDPLNPNISPEVVRGINAVGSDMTQRLDREGKVGAVSRQQYDQWWNGGLRSTPAFHNQVGLLTETAHASATPSYDDPTKFKPTFSYQGVSTKEPSAFYPSPYKGGWWHLSQSCDYIETTSWAYLRVADTDRQSWLYGMYQMAAQSVEAGGNKAYIVRSDQKDFGTATKMINVLREGGVEVEQARSAFTAAGSSYPSGSFIVREAQPFRNYVVDLMNPQTYPDRRNPDGSPERPYDMAGWTLPMQMGVDVQKVDSKFVADTAPVDRAAVPQFRMPDATPGYAYALDPRVNDSFTAAEQLLKAGDTVTRSTDSVQTDLGSWPAGTFLVHPRSGVQGRLQTQAERLGLRVGAVAAEPADQATLAAPRIGMYHGWGGNSDEGWTRYVLEQFKLPYQRVHDADVRSGDLNDKFDVIVLPDASYSSMLNGRPAGSLPSKYTGGMTAGGVANLEKFVQGGGRLVTVNGASELPIKAFDDFGVSDVTDDASSSDYYSPGSILAGAADTDDPLTWGLDKKVDLYSQGSPAFEVAADAPQGWTAPVSYADSNLLRSGWLLGNDVIKGKSDVVEMPHGNGDVVLLGMSVQHRAQAHGTYKLLFNALFRPTEG
ncbi:MAG TPA: M14 metallopeptidase family protein, partial [Microlunatus sp.]